MRQHTLKRLFFISRPFSWLNTAFPFAAGYIVDGGHLNLELIVGTIYFLGPYNLLLYGLKDVFDYEPDIRKSRKGDIESIKEDKTFHLIILLSSLIFNVPFVLFLLINGNFLGSLVLTLLLFFVVAYSITGLRLKEIPILDSVTSSIHFTGPLIYALSLLPESSHVPFTYVLAFFLWGMASHALGAIRNIIPDKKVKLTSIATFFGARNAVWFSILLYSLASLLVLRQNFTYFTVGFLGILYILNILPYIFITDKTSQKISKAWHRFVWLNLCSGFIVTTVLIFTLIKT